MGNALGGGRMRGLITWAIALFGATGLSFSAVAQPTSLIDKAIWFSDRGDIVAVQQQVDALYLALARVNQLPSRTISVKVQPPTYYLVDALRKEKVLFSAGVSPTLENVLCALNTAKFTVPGMCTWTDTCLESMEPSRCKTTLSRTIGDTQTELVVPNVGFAIRTVFSRLNKRSAISMRQFLTESAYDCAGERYKICLNIMEGRNGWRPAHSRIPFQCPPGMFEKCFDTYGGILDVPTLSLSATLAISYPQDSDAGSTKAQIKEALTSQRVIIEPRGQFDQAPPASSSILLPSVALPWPEPKRTYLSKNFPANLSLLDSQVDVDHCGLKAILPNLVSADKPEPRFRQLAGLLRDSSIKDLCKCTPDSECVTDRKALFLANEKLLSDVCPFLVNIPPPSEVFKDPVTSLGGHGTHLLGLIATNLYPAVADCRISGTSNYGGLFAPSHAKHRIFLGDVSSPDDKSELDREKLTFMIGDFDIGTPRQHVVNLSLSFRRSDMEHRTRSDMCSNAETLFVVQPGYVPDNPPLEQASPDLTNNCNSVPGCLGDIPNVVSVVGVERTAGIADDKPEYKALPGYRYGIGEKCCSLASPGQPLVSYFPGDRLALIGGQSQATALVSAVAMTISAQRSRDVLKNAWIWPEHIKNRLIYTADLDASLRAIVTGGFVNPRKAAENLFQYVVVPASDAKIDVKEIPGGKLVLSGTAKEIALKFQANSTGGELVFDRVDILNTNDTSVDGRFGLQTSVGKLRANKETAPVGYQFMNFSWLKRMQHRIGAEYDIFALRDPASFQAKSVCGTQGYQREPEQLDRATASLLDETVGRKFVGDLPGGRLRVEFSLGQLRDYFAPIVSGSQLEVIRAIEDYK